MEAKCESIMEKNSVEKIIPVTLIKDEDYGRNENILSPRNGNNFTHINQLNDFFKKLDLQPSTNEEKKQQLVGNINNIIEALNVVLIKPFSSKTLLYLGTPLFLNGTDIQNSGTKFTLLGYIDDIFGSIAEPMYSVTINCNLKHMLNTDTQVYYFPNNPDTLYMYIEHKVNNVTNNGKYNIITRN
ncbi:uncharacterized protein LOC143186886 isoform X1 [Calliopsis andreniformis]|uniref:uncharacterized protein LOC143186886 isoform X1 n=1 Tax=Calliopsis andreniformis TaxID=337506 RepID=UPI003FCC81FC